MTEYSLASAGRSDRPARHPYLKASLAALLALAVIPAGAAAQWASPEVTGALRSASGDKELRAYYRARDYRPLWIRGGTIGHEGDRLLDLVASADLDGLDPGDYRPRSLAEAIERARMGSPRDLARAEMLLSRTLAHYVRDMRRPRRTDMVYVDKELAPVRPPLRSVLESAAAAPSLQSYLDDLGWMHPVYGQLRRALESQAFGEGERRVAGVQVPAGPLLRPGASGERVRMLRLRLGLEPEGPYDNRVADAVRDVQAANGLPQDGVAGPMTLAALNGTGGGQDIGPEREEILRINLERARALPANPGSKYILVDAASQRLWAYENGRVRDTMKVIVGKSTEQTPMISGLIRFAQVNPYWNIPPDLVKTRVVPIALGKGPGALNGRYEVLSDFTANARTLDPSSVDWRAVAAGRKEVRVRQLPGPDNAMGKMKFMFPNELGIYLHDTPEKHLFGKADRRFSSGCVRVEDAPRLARWLFGKQLNVPTRGRERQVNLPKPVPVFITYMTAMPEGRQIAYRTDVYNRDQAQLARLGSRSFSSR